MTWWLTDFNGVALPTRMPEDDAGAGTVDSTIVDSIGGAVDMYGSRVQTQRRARIAHLGTYLGENAVLVTSIGDFIVTDAGDNLYLGDAADDLRNQRDGIAAMLGWRGTLWRQAASGARQWRTARLVDVEATDTLDNAGTVLAVQTTYETVMDGWRAQTATTTSDTTIDSTMRGMLITNAGDATVYDAVLTVTRTSGTITGVTVFNNDINWTWTGSMGAGASLVVNAGAQTVRLSGVSAYSGFVLNAGHTARGWLQLNMGDNSLTITTTGGAANVSIAHYDRYR